MTHHVERTVALFQMQDRAAALAQLGEWRLERALEKLDAALAATLGGRDGAHHVDRAAGSAEIVAVLEGVERLEALGRLQAAIAAFQRDTGLRVLAAWSHDDDGAEPLGTLFSRAELAMHERRNQVLAEAA
ncbi:MAG TPA: hypothetical protein VFL14_16325 [Xanthomonadales bacterium]|nr:hypothetical protein [Xanthomonadales bacterium]